MKLALSCALLLLGIRIAAGSSASDDFTGCIFVVNLEQAQDREKLAASVAVGLVNRALGKPAAVALNSPNDWKWVSNIQEGPELREHRWVKASPADFLAYAVAIGAARNVIHYDAAEPWALANVVTLAGLESAIPMPYIFQQGLDEAAPYPYPGNDSLKLPYKPRLVQIDEAPPRGLKRGWGSIKTSLGLDALGGNLSAGVEDPFQGLAGLPVLQGFNRWVDELDATLWAWVHLSPRCKATDEIIVIQRPEVLKGGFLADFTVMRQLFVFFLPKMCSPGAQQLLFNAMTTPAHTKRKQLKVMGYSTEDEVVADCSLHHTEISLVSDWSPNLSFYSLMQPLTSNLTQIARGPKLIYNPNDTYLAVVNSDGDNIQMENNGNRDGMEARVKLCAQKGNVCPPLAWTISNQLVTLAPFMLQWYFNQAEKTQMDTFLMGPTGYGFLHPAAIASDDPLLDEFVAKTVEAAHQLSMTSYVHWDIDSNGLTQKSMAHLGMSHGQQSMAEESESDAKPLQDERRAVQASRRLHALLSNESDYDTPKKGQTLEGLTSLPNQRATGNSLAREAFLQRFDGSVIDTVFAPGEYRIPDWIGNTVGIQEQFRWGKEESNLSAVVERLNDMPRGTIGYIYKIFEVDMKEYELLAQKIHGHVHLVDHRQMHDLALQKKQLDEADALTAYAASHHLELLRR